MQGDLRVLDPIWTTANITAYHGAMIYDTLFALDDKFAATAADGRRNGALSDDKLTYTFELRDGLQLLRRHGGDGRRTASPRSGAGRRATAAAST